MMKVLSHMSRKEQARWPRDGTASGEAVATASPRLPRIASAVLLSRVIQPTERGKHGELGG